jgi:hypothetical protein
MVSPGSAGVAFLMVAAGPISVPLECSAAMYTLPLVALVPIVKKAGARGFHVHCHGCAGQAVVGGLDLRGAHRHGGGNQKVHLRIAHEAYRNRRAVDRDAHTVYFGGKRAAGKLPGARRRGQSISLDLRPTYWERSVPAMKLAPFWIPDTAKDGAAWMLASSPCDCTGSLFGPPPIPAVMYSVPGSSL